MQLGRKEAQCIDLLPPAAQKQKSNRWLAIKLTIAQVAIFLCFTLVFIGLRNIDARAQEESSRLLYGIDALRNSPEVGVAIYHMEASIYLYEEAAFFAEHLPYGFNPEWLNEILSLGSITSFDYDGYNILINGIASDFHEVEVFRQLLSDSYFFETVGLGNIRSLGEDRFFFDLRLTPVQ